VKTHAWVNHEQLLDKCLVGMLVPGEEEQEEASDATTTDDTGAQQQHEQVDDDDELTQEQEAELTMFPAREGQQVRK
jgi:nucleosome binding factor SPN SPT16 subunit